MLTTNEELKKLLSEVKTIAVVGASPKPWRDSGSISNFLSKRGYTVFPVNPKYTEVHGMKCYPDLKSIPEKIDLVDIFRDPREIDAVIDEAIALNAKAVWLQLGVVNPQAAQKAENAGLQVVMDRCIAIEYRALM
ncbi:MAG: CoA-binding protein [Bacteroidetes bacterium]|nr:CoA-binding protein [Bacteroidota bacterium]